jgi:uncharacterized protein (DUF433 family)
MSVTTLLTSAQFVVNQEGEKTAAVLDMETWQQLVAWANQQDLPITQTADVVGGVARLAGTRIPVWALVQYRRLGASDAELLKIYPTLSATDLAHAWAYYETHQAEIEQEIIANEMVFES